jgi:acyl carrier protein
MAAKFKVCDLRVQLAADQLLPPRTCRSAQRTAHQHAGHCRAESARLNWRLAADLSFAAWRFCEKSRKTMDARAPPQLDFDANDVRTLIANYLGIEAELVTDEVHFSNDFDLDSLGRLELLILIEEEFFGVEFSDTAHQIEVVGDLIRHVEIMTNAVRVKNRRSAASAPRTSAARRPPT